MRLIDKIFNKNKKKNKMIGDETPLDQALKLLHTEPILLANEKKESHEVYQGLGAISPNYFNNKPLVILATYSRKENTSVNKTITISIEYSEEGYIDNGTYPALIQEETEVEGLKINTLGVKYLTITSDFIEKYNSLMKEKYESTDIKYSLLKCRKG